MKYNFEGQTIELPEWCKYWTEEEKRDAAIAIINAPTPTIEEIEDMEEKRVASLIDEDVLRLELREAGFRRNEIEDICYYYYSGCSLDDAMQRARA